MAEFTERHEKMIEETHDSVIEIKVVLLGANGDRGLVGKLDDNCKEVDKLKSSHRTLIGILVGSGILTGSAVVGITKLLGG